MALGEGFVYGTNGYTRAYYKNGQVYPNHSTAFNSIIGSYDGAYVYDRYGGKIGKMEGDHVIEPYYLGTERYVTAQYGSVYRGRWRELGNDGTYSITSGTDGEAAAAAWIAMHALDGGAQAAPGKAATAAQTTAKTGGAGEGAMALLILAIMAAVIALLVFLFRQFGTLMLIFIPAALLLVFAIACLIDLVRGDVGRGGNMAVGYKILRILCAIVIAVGVAIIYALGMAFILGAVAWFYKGPLASNAVLTTRYEISIVLWGIVGVFGGYVYTEDWFPQKKKR